MQYSITLPKVTHLYPDLKTQNRQATTTRNTKMSNTATTNNDWDIECMFWLEEKRLRANRCSCPEIIYKDIEKWFMENSEFKSLYYSCKHRPELRSNKITKESTIQNNNFLKILSKILNSIQNFNSLLDINSYSEYHYFMNDLYTDYNQYYFPENRDWYYNPCKTQIDIYDATTRDLEQGFNPDLKYPHNYKDYYMFTESCDKFPGITRLVICSITSFLFNLMTSKEFIHYIKDINNLFPRMKNSVKQKLIEFKNEKFYSSNWKGSNYYYKKIFLKPIYLHDMEIPDEIVSLRHYTCFEDMICGHPKASHGWMYESLQELKKLNLITT